MKYFVLLLSWLLCSAGFGFDYPIGIPDAWIEPDVAAPARPDPWTSEVPGYYYIDWNTGIDAGRTYGTPTAPRKSIPFAVLPAGTRWEFAAGNYGGGGERHLQAGGTSGAWVANTSGPVWFIGAAGNTSNMEIATYIYGSYFYIDGLKWHRSSGHILQYGSAAVDYASDHMMIRNCLVDGDGHISFGLAVGGKVGQIQQHFIIYNNIFREFGDMEQTEDNDQNAFATGDYVFDLWFLDNVCHTCTAGVRYGAAGGADASDAAELAMRGYFGRNEIYNILQAGLFVKYAKDVVFSENYVHDIVDTEWSPSKCVGVQYGPKGIWFIFNRLEGADELVPGGLGNYGVYHASTDGDVTPVAEDWPVYYIGNTLSGFLPQEPYNNLNGGGSCAICLRGSETRYVVNNTIYNSCGGIYTDGNTATSTTVLSNNIVMNITTAGSGATDGKHIMFGEGALDANFDTDYNLCYQEGGSVYYRYNAGNYTGHAAFAAATPEGDNDIEGDPLFTDADAGDFTIPTGSPAKDAGSATVVDDLEALYFSTFGVSIEFDKAGGARPHNTDYDIGAYEFGAVPPDPEVPVNISIPTITGTPTEGQTLTGGNGSWTGTPSPTFARQWRRNGSDIVGETGTTYELQAADVGTTITLRVTGTNTEGSDVADSDPTATVSGLGGTLNATTLNITTLNLGP